MVIEEPAVSAGCAGISELQHAVCSEHHILLPVDGGCLAALSEACFGCCPQLGTAMTTTDPALGVPRVALVEPEEQTRRGLWTAKQQICMHGLNLDANTSLVDSKTNLSSLLRCPFFEDRVPGTGFLCFTEGACVIIKSCRSS